MGDKLNCLSLISIMPHLFSYHFPACLYFSPLLILPLFFTGTIKMLKFVFALAFALSLTSFAVVAEANESPIRGRVARRQASSGSDATFAKAREDTRATRDAKGAGG
jgi:hypothetical protein